jgi:hypothetical protein
MCRQAIHVHKLAKQLFGAKYSSLFCDSPFNCVITISMLTFLPGDNASLGNDGHVANNVRVISGMYKGCFGEVVKETEKMVYVQFHDTGHPPRRLMKRSVAYVACTMPYAIAVDIISESREHINETNKRVTKFREEQLRHVQELLEEVKALRDQVERKVLPKLPAPEKAKFYSECQHAFEVVTLLEMDVHEVTKLWRIVSTACHSAVSYLDRSWDDNNTIPVDHPVRRRAARQHLNARVHVIEDNP